MEVGPLRRLSGALGLIALVPIAVALVAGRIDESTAALRAVVTLVVVVAAGRAVRWGLAFLARYLERDSTT